MNSPQPSCLVIEDDSIARLTYKNILEKRGFQVLEADDGFQALSVLFENGPVDFLLVDWNLKNMDGIDFVRAIRSIETIKDCKVVMVTGHDDRNSIQQAMDCGVNAYLLKEQFKPKILLEKLVNLGILSAEEVVDNA